MERKLIPLLIAFAIFFGLSSEFADRNPEQNASAFPFAIHVNGNPIGLADALVHNNKSYVGLRELCEKMGMTVEWVDPNHQQMPIPGGTFPAGINIINPTFVHTKEVTKYDETNRTIKAVDITGIYKKFKMGKGYQYYFSDEGLVIDGANKQVLKLNYNPSNQLMYVSVEEFKEKIQPYLIDICMQEDKPVPSEKKVEAKKPQKPAALSREQQKKIYDTFTRALKKEKNFDAKILPTIEDAVGKDKMMEIAGQYQQEYGDSESYSAWKTALKSTYEESKANQFTKEQLKEIYIVTCDLETGNAALSEMQYSPETPSHAPSHEADRLWEQDQQNKKQ